MKNLDISEKAIRKFYLQMFAAMSILGTIFLLRHKGGYRICYPASVFFLLGALKPNVARPLYYAWMKLFFAVEWVVTRSIMLVIFYLIIAPFGLVMRALGKDPLDRRMEKAKGSYWKEKPKLAFQPSDYERQF